ncbi:DUF3078 domain-containing protein [Tenacibaculum xiamenense]|uniref:DUF3078 domain-containing protein n=1 Tax=Tenacibaculum xiamenense TaxID=1261553 RepID=UPI0038960CBA
MKEKTLILLFSFSALIINAQNKKKDSISYWKKEGNVSFIFNQSSFNNWSTGGANVITGNLSFNCDFNYTKENWIWDNKIIASYGLTKVKGSEVQKTDDRLEVISVLAKKGNGYWYYSLLFNFRAQMNSTEDDSGIELSDLLSPSYFYFGPGVLWKKNDKLKVNISPINSKLILVKPKFTNNLPPNTSYFGVQSGETSRYEMGIAINGYFKIEIIKNIIIENIINIYSNYLDKPKNIDFDFTANFTMVFNKYISTNLTFQTVYDDNVYKGFQTRQLFGLGVNYTF